MIVILDYGSGNPRSILKVFRKLDIPAEISAHVEVVAAADKLVLPGVGHFGTCMGQLVESGLGAVLADKVLNDTTPLLGICVGMQMLTTGSEEANTPGLAWIPGRAIKFPLEVEGRSLRVPHVGWNAVRASDDPLFRTIADGERFYFTHSYHVVCEDEADVIGWTSYGYDFPSAIRHGNMYGFQFHPERSRLGGVALLKNFAEAA